MSFRKEENSRKTYLCSADRYYIIFEFPIKSVFKQNIFIKIFDNLETFEIYFIKGSVANPVQGFNSTFIVSCMDCEKTSVTIPTAIQEYLKNYRGSYPLDKNFKFIYFGPGGLSIAVNEQVKRTI
jgi:hypothetical protein